MHSQNSSNNTCDVFDSCWYPMIALANQTVLSSSVPIVVFMILLMVGGIPGNVLVIAVYTNQKNKTNALLFILCLAYVDLITLCFVHPYVIFKLFYSSDQDWERWCKTFEFGIHASLSVSVAILFMVSIDRFIAILFPLKYFRYQAKVKYVLIGCCVFGVGMSLPIVLFYGKRRVNVIVADSIIPGYVCDTSDEYQKSSSKIMFSSVMFFLFVFVCFTLVFCYSCVARKAYQTRKVHPSRINIEAVATKVDSKSSSTNIYAIPSVSTEDCTNMQKRSIQSLKNRNRSQFTTIGVFDSKQQHSTSQTNRLSNKQPKKHTREQELALARKVLPKKLKAAKILSLVTLVFILSWMPFWIVNLTAIGADPSCSFYQYVFRNFLCHLFYLNNAVNPVIYALVNKNFREDCRKMFNKVVNNI